MFLKLEHVNRGHVSLIECDEIRFNELLKNEYKPITIDVEKNRVWQSHQVDPKEYNFFVMNDKGDTIESYRWATVYKRRDNENK